MSIAASMERTIKYLENLWQRDNGDFDKTFPDIVSDLKSDVDRVRGLEMTGIFLSPPEGEQHDNA